LSSLELAWTERNWEETRRLAHRIKGSAANSSALRSMQVATELEAAAKKAQDYELVDILMVRLREAIVELQRYVAGDPSHAAP
jgi:HPt (histidine-containing phosphotransfer) domain-containing protein